MLPVMRVGLTGGIGSGKTEVARRLSALGAVVIDYDLLAREVVAPGTPGLRQVAAEFGPEVVADGGLDRPRLAELVFADPAALVRLNAIVHPLVAARAAELEAEAGPAVVVVHDIPLLVENGLAPAFDAVVVVDVEDPEVQVRRVVARGLGEVDARARVAAQASRAERLAVATHVVSNDAGFEALDRQVRALWGELGQYVAGR